MVRGFYRRRVLDAAAHTFFDGRPSARVLAVGLCLERSGSRRAVPVASTVVGYALVLPNFRAGMAVQRSADGHLTLEVR
jgi:hypothetical protein